MATLTLRTIFEAGTVLGLLEEPEFAHNVAIQAAREVKPTSDHYLAVFVFTAEPLDDGTRVLRIISTTVLGVQRYTTTRLRYQSVYPAEADGYTATRHQREVGVGYFDAVAMAISGGKSSTTAFAGSTEADQFDDGHVEVTTAYDRYDDGLVHNHQWAMTAM